MLFNIFHPRHKIMSKLKNDERTSPKLEEKKEDNSPLDRILDSNACRRLFAWALPPSSHGRAFRALDSAMKKEQKERWNFDFETETPLPGRYQWVRTDGSANGHSNKGTVSPNRTVQNGETTKERRRSRRNSTSRLKSRKPSEERCCTRSCDTPSTLNEGPPRRSKRRRDPPPPHSKWK